MSRNPEIELTKLLTIMQRLRDPESGCPWDLEQTFRSIAPSTLEEAYEVVDAIERDDLVHLREELGDLLFQVVYYTQMAEEEGYFDFASVATAISDKLLRRHPHVFPDGTLASRVDPDNRPSEAFVTQQWEQIKAEERQEKGKSGVLADIPTGLPALNRAHKIQKRVAEVGFDWSNIDGVLEKLQEEIGELRQAINTGDQTSIADELGDCLFTMVNICRHGSVDAETALRSTNSKFSQRFQRVEQLAEEAQVDLSQCSSEQLEAFWQSVKAENKQT